MIIPQSQNLYSQNFNSNFVEFVWQFPYKNNLKSQILLQVNKENEPYLESGIINESGDYVLDFSSTNSLTYGTRELSIKELKQSVEEAKKFLN